MNFASNNLMEIKKHVLKVDKTAHYSTYGVLNKQTKYFWFALHGSHMLCGQILYKFKNFNPKEHFIVAPEGLSRFYLKGFSGDVVATWMTKEDRLIEIDDFTDYLDTLYLQYLEQIPKSAKKIIFGFSQGGTTAFRWMDKRKVSVDAILAYSSWIPEDINFTRSKTDFASKEMIYSLGLQDEFLNEDRLNFQKNLVKKYNFPIIYHFYDGIHKIDRNQLESIFNSYLKSK